MQLQQLIKDFLEYLEIEKNVSKLTIRNYRHYLNRFLAHLRQGYGGQAFPTLSDITPEKVRQYRLYLSRFTDENNLTLKRITQNYHLIALRSFLKFLARKGQKALAPETIELGKAESHSIKFLSREQIDQLLNMPETRRDKAILEVLFSTGLRVSELVNLNRDQINFKRREFGVIGKGRRPRIVFLSQKAADWLQQYLNERTDQDKALFIRYSGKKSETLRLSARSVQRLVEKYVKKARLPIKITPHGLRHSFATDLLGGGADLRAIQELLGHKNVSTTQVYTHITNPQLKQIHEKFHRASQS
ncbi:hypothetical protein A3A79_00630 [Candidatus Gottesmanbacteria bacterium RIFCSPLOWO2_01_FULL_43_11b]|uniref:Tyrosine recombinase XerC n=1 Tax=Candidatus Gottesmanbacteria bacterium RIFCSPLOWO2_01_FULL_43_11b TaxID=1798392 RepID=A0A1F6AIW4_9BACT|nr:MAG: hypothetical protein A3A79_00630 [Candidatus Gottesmanbacteria bacterium RIFCSPLOWO2_01_FULL_43_11b]